MDVAESLEGFARLREREGRVERAVVGVTAAGAQAAERDIGGDLGNGGGARGEHFSGERAPIRPASAVHEHQGEPRARVRRVQVVLLGERDVVAQRALRAVELVHLPKAPAEHPVPVGDAMLKLVRPRDLEAVLDQADTTLDVSGSHGRGPHHGEPPREALRLVQAPREVDRLLAQRTASSLSSFTIWAYARIPYAVASSALAGNASSVSTADRLAASASAVWPTAMWRTVNRAR